MRRAVLLLAVGLLVAAPTAAALTKPQAISLVKAMLTKRAAKCSIERIHSVTATAPSLDKFKVTAKVTQAGYPTTLVYTVLGNKKIVANGPLEAEILAGHC
jgi:hypothetical protein